MSARIWAILLGLSQSALAGPEQSPTTQAHGFIRPSNDEHAQPIWGREGGIQVGLWPTGGGPRGLIRIYAPYLENPRDQVINFIAVEPLVRGKRGFSELEHSKLDGVPGKRMWTLDELPRSAKAAQPPIRPARGRLIDIDGVQALSFYIVIEPFNNGAQPVVQVILRRDRPYEVEFRIFSAADGAKMDACILTATMGNYARLRRLHLKDQILEASKLWPGFVSKEPWLRGFAPHVQWGIEHLSVRDGQAQVVATPDEADPSAARYAPDTAAWWRYKGKPAMQFWRAAAQPDLLVRVNGRRVYWGSSSEIPGGVAFENFEMQCPFAPGQQFIFGVRELDTPPQKIDG